MIHTFTLNPSLDMVVSVDDFKVGKTNRSYDESIYPGGKGLNVSFVLSNLGIDNTAVYFAAGFVGDEITRMLSDRGVHTHLLPIENGVSRINLKLRSIEGTEINGSGPEITPSDEARLFAYLDTVKSGDFIVLSGSVPKSVRPDIYERMIKAVSDRNIRTVVDASGRLLENTLDHNPFLIKPNLQELEEYSGHRLESMEEIIQEAGKLRDRGAENVLISMSGDGAVLAAADGAVYRIGVPEGELVNSVGAGDSMVAGFIAGFLKYGEYKASLAMAAAAGSACAYAEGFPVSESIEKYFRILT